MTVTRSISQATRGVNLIKPQMTLQYLAAGTVSIIVLMIIWKAGGMVFDQGGRFIQGHVPGVKTPDYAVALGIE